MGGEKTLPRAIIGVWNKKNRCGIKRLTSEEMFVLNVNSLFMGQKQTRGVVNVTWK